MEVIAIHCNQCRERYCTQKVSIFAGLSVEENAEIHGLIQRLSFKKGEFLVLDGQPYDRLMIVHGGRLKAYRDTADGKQQILHLFGPGDFLGERSLFTETNSAYTVEALTDVAVCTIPSLAFQELLDVYPSIAKKILETLSDRLTHMERTIESMGAKTIDKRVSAVLVDFTEKFGKRQGNQYELELPLNREGIANYIGLTRETVTRKMKRLERDGLIRAVGNKKIEILDWYALRDSGE
jgi:CRP/FNR family transcriptional regulator